jgi:cyclohexanone monooxygenase
MFKTIIENMNKGAQGADVAGLMQLADDMQMESIRNRVSQVVKDQKTAEALKPYYMRWCKR